METTQAKLTYSNPRERVVIEDWPSGRTNKVRAVFEVEKTSRGERACRTTTGKTKKLTYAGRVRFVDGDDGRLYIIEDSANYSMISVMQGTLFSHETIHKSADPDRYATVLALFD